MAVAQRPVCLLFDIGGVCVSLETSINPIASNDIADSFTGRIAIPGYSRL